MPSRSLLVSPRKTDRPRFDFQKEINIDNLMLEGVRPPIYVTTMEQEVYVKVGILESEIEAQLLDSILNERNIPHHIQSYHDTAYDGLFQTQRGWGHVSCPRLWSEEVGGILSEIRQAAEQGEQPIITA